jgi:Domain of unknown function (DUF4292)
MNKTYKGRYHILILLLLVVACRTAKTQLSPKSELKKLSPYMVDYQWFEAKANVTYAGGFNELAFNANFRLQKDKVIWISLTGPLSIEGGRALITPDSVKVVDRVNKKIYIGTFQAFCGKYNLPITFSQLQELIVGNVLNEDVLKLPAKTDGDYKNYTENNKEITKIVYINLKNYTVEKISLKDKPSQRELLLSFANYTENKGKLFSNARKIEINTYHEKSTIQMEFSKYTFGQKNEFPFSTPEKYEVITL